MAEREHALSKQDPCLVVLYRSIILCETIYNSVNNPITNKARFDEHKVSTTELVSEIEKALDNYPYWTKGKLQLTYLVTLKYDLISYQTLIWQNKTIDESKRTFDREKQEYYAIIKQLKSCFT